jgi:hypothetical protein
MEHWIYWAAAIGLADLLLLLMVRGADERRTQQRSGSTRLGVEA